MKNHALISLIRAKYVSLNHQQKSIVILLAALLGMLSILILFKCCLAIAANKKNLAPEPIIIRQEKKIIIPKNSPLRSQMKVITVKASSAPHIVSFPGIIEADPSHIVNILSPFAGRLLALKVKLGDTVKKGQILAVIRSPGLAQAHTDHEKALSVLKLTTEALKRAQRVNRAGANSIKDVDMAQNDYIQALAEANRTKAILKTIGKNGFSLLNIKTPMPGRITAINYGIGSYINDPTSSLLTVSNIKSVWVTASIPENLAGVVSKNLAVEVFLPAYPKQILRGKVTFVSAFLEPDTRRNKTRITFPNPDGKLQPNMFATVKIALTQSNQIIIPISAILMNNDTTAVYVEITPWTFARREVELGTEDGENVRILAGLDVGERIVTSGGVLVND